MGRISYIENFEKWREEFSFFLPVRIRFSETDMFGHVNNVSPFVYFEEARIAFLKEIGLFQELDTEAESIPIVADLQCDYHRQMYFNDELKLYVKVNEVGNTSFDLHYLGINQNQEICITGRGRMVLINPATGKSISLTDKEKTCLHP